MKTQDSRAPMNGAVVVSMSDVRSTGPGIDYGSTKTDVVSGYEDTLHAVRSGLVGLAGGLHVLLEEASGGTHDGHRLESMLMAEVERLQRLVAPEPTVEQNSVDPELVDLDRLIGDVVMSRRMAGQEVAWSPTGHTIEGHHDDLVEVLNILLVNSWRHAGGAPARIEVLDAGGRVQITVSDDGPGVPAELREAIFERGVRRTFSPGQGLGLAIARELVGLQQGSLELRQDASRGACFDICLDRAALHGAA